jgi:quinol monooxygenase YgiN
VRTGLTVIAYITAKASHQDQVREALLDLVAQTRNEKGCINYDLHQSQENASEFAIYENWENATDLDAHAKSPHIQAFTRNARHLLEGPAEIRKWSMVSEINCAHLLLVRPPVVDASSHADDHGKHKEQP